MPFHGIQPGREWIFTPSPNKDIAVNDREAWRLYPEYRHAYNKLAIARQQGITAHPCTTSPQDHGISAEQKVFVKPITNLAGGAKDARIMQVSEVPNDPELFWTDIFQGPHTSTDCLLLNGKVKWFGHSLSSEEKNQHRSIYWQLGIDLSDAEPEMTDFIESALPGYTGLCNFERIGDKVIELHLRGSNGFFDRYPKDFINAWIKLKDKNEWINPGALHPGVIYSIFSDSPLPINHQNIAQAHDVVVRTDPFTIDRSGLIYAATLDTAKAAYAELTASPR